MALQLACADFTFPLLSHDQALDIIALLGFKYLDLGFFSGRSHLKPEDVGTNLAGAAREMRNKLESRGLELADLYLQPAANFMDRAPNHPDQNVRRQSREIFQRAIEFALRCNAPHFSELPGIPFEKEPVEEGLKRSAEELAWRADYAAQSGLIYSVEAHIGSIVPTPEDALRLVQSAPGLTLTLDYGHFTYQAIPDERVEPLIKHASHFHARCGAPQRLQTSLKNNTIDFKRILKVMGETKYAGRIGVEYVWIDWEHCNEVDNISETILLRSHLQEACQ